jgi:trehalose 6-phosphate synthase
MTARSGNERRQFDPTQRDPLSAQRDLFTVVGGVEHDSTWLDGRLANVGFVKDYVYRASTEEVLAGAYRAADLCLVSSLQDGMNLVAKEFLAAQVEERGVLVLSRFAGAAEEIDGAILINPFNIDGFVQGIRRALELSEAERRVRMHRMRSHLRENTIFDWLASILSRADQIVRARDGTRGGRSSRAARTGA